jgi:glycosyltransferase involved in cell wall biosynthesis
VPKLSVISNFYNCPDKVADQVERWSQIAPKLLRQIEFILVDDCSDPVPDVKKRGLNLRLFRVDTDIAWNQPGARNLGALNARADWGLFFDIDQVLDNDVLGTLLDGLDQLDSKTLYYLKLKEALFDSIENQMADFHINTFLTCLPKFRTMGMYDEDFAGHYGFDDVFLPVFWDMNGGKRAVLTNPRFFEKQLDFATTNLDRDLSYNRDLVNRKVAALRQFLPGPIPKPAPLLRFDWHEVELDGSSDNAGAGPHRHVMSKLWNGIDPYANFPTALFAVDTSGWNSNHPYLAKTIVELRPRITLEVGVWKGGSTLTMANALRENGVEGVVIAVDTWLGSCEHWASPHMQAELCFQQGYPSIYHKFLGNVLSLGLSEFVVPCPLDSGNAAQLMAMYKITPSVIHIDCGNDFATVLTDLQRWWPLLTDGGYMICDGYDESKVVRPEVQRAAEAFLAVTPHVNFECAPYKCRFQKVG